MPGATLVTTDARVETSWANIIPGQFRTVGGIVQQGALLPAVVAAACGGALPADPLPCAE
jgi:hypothetical protein